MQAAVDNVSSTAQQAYNRAPDLGFTQAAQGAYNRAPDLGIQSTINRYSSNNNNNNSNHHDDDGSAPHSTSQQLQRPPKSGERARSNGGAAPAIDFHAQQQDLRQISKDRGPSSQDRLGKSQREIGTEYGIPTRAGAGTTASPDAKAKEALVKSKKSGKNKPQQAHVPQDYLAEPCPDANAGTGKVDDVQQRHATRRQPSKVANGGGAAAAAADNDRRQASNATQNSKASSTATSEKRRSMGVRLRDQVRGELKIIKGSLTNNHETINRGLSIKNGEVA